MLKTGDFTLCSLFLIEAVNKQMRVCFKYMGETQLVGLE